MLTPFFQRLGWFVLLLMLQIFVFSRIHLGGYATPLPYIYLLLILPKNSARSVGVFLGFLMGLGVDLFTNTLGAAAAATTLVGLLTPIFLPLFAPEEKMDEDFVPSARSMGWMPFARYAALLSVIQCVVSFGLESLSLFNFGSLLLTIGASSLFTWVTILAIERVRTAPHRN